MHMKRYIGAASTSPAKDEARKFPEFLGNLEGWLKQQMPHGYGLNGTQFYGNNYIIEFEIIPTYYGKEFGDYIILKYDWNDADKYAVVYVHDGDETIVGYGDSLDDTVMIEVLQRELYGICDDHLTNLVNSQ